MPMGLGRLGDITNPWRKKIRASKGILFCVGTEMNNVSLNLNQKTIANTYLAKTQPGLCRISLPATFEPRFRTLWMDRISQIQV